MSPNTKQESSRYQMFAFVSCHSLWQVLVAWNEAGAYVSMDFDQLNKKIYKLLTRILLQMLEIIWEGDVQHFDRASELISHSGPDTGLRHTHSPPLCDEEPGFPITLK
jgi:hypothetical protein